MKVALVHDWLSVYAGSESVVKSILEIYPDADLFVAVDFMQGKDRAFLKDVNIRTSFIQKLPFSKKFFRHYLFLMPLAIEQFDLSKYKLIISSSHSVSKGVITGPDQVHICYTHSPMRYIWDLQHQYIKKIGGLKGALIRVLFHYLRLWDVCAANRVDYFIANSGFIQKRIEKIYRRNSEVIYPPVSISGNQQVVKKKDFFITVSRLVPYKKVDIIVEAFKNMPQKKLIVIGDGTDMPQIKKISKTCSNIEILGHQSDDIVRELISESRAFIFAAEEDFGITVVEAQAYGTPVIAYAKGGAKETVIDNVTGLFFGEQNSQGVIDAVKRFEEIEKDFNPNDLIIHAEKFNKSNFKANFSSFVNRVVENNADN